VKQSNLLRTPFGNVINVLGKLFCTTNHESDSLLRPTIQLRSCIVLHISNAPTVGGKRCDKRFGEKLHSSLCYSQFVLNTILLSRRALLCSIIVSG